MLRCRDLSPPLLLLLLLLPDTVFCVAATSSCGQRETEPRRDAAARVPVIRTRNLCRVGSPTRRPTPRPDQPISVVTRTLRRRRQDDQPTDHRDQVRHSWHDYVFFFLSSSLPRPICNRCITCTTVVQNRVRRTPSEFRRDAVAA